MRPDHVDADLDAEHDEAGEERRGEQGRFGGQPGIADRTDDRHRQQKQKRNARGTGAAAATSTASARRRCRRVEVTAAASAAVAGGRFAAVSSVGVQPDKKK